MKTWEERPSEVAHLLNPAFCGEIIRRVLEGHSVVETQGMPFSLSFLVLPIIFDKGIRNAMPRRAATNMKAMHVWLQEHPDLRVGFPERARNLVPFTKEALAFLLQNQAAGHNQQGNLISIRPTSAAQTASLQAREDEVADCYNRALILGRWFAMARSPITVFTMWGVRP